MNSRRLIAPPGQGSRIVAGQTGRLEVVRLALVRCPLWVNNGHRDWLKECPLYPQKRTWLHFNYEYTPWSCPL